ncbi:MAG: trimeric autotransporter adhesin [Actinomycetota bacterium]|nr:trimeric autotransporter adhesin [Actinomycetota bacterium]
MAAARHDAGRRTWRSVAVGLLLATGLAPAAVAIPAAAASANGGIITTVAGGPGLGAATTVGMEGAAIAVHRGRLYVADRARSVVRVVDPTTGEQHPIAGVGPILIVGGPTFAGDGGPAVDARLFSPAGIAVAPDGTVYVSDSGNNRVRRIDPSGTITTVAGNGVAGASGDGGPAVSASLTNPAALALSPEGSLFFLEGNTGRVRRVGPDGIITTLVSAVESNDDLVVGPVNLAIDPAGVLYLADADRILRVDADGGVSIAVGGGAETADGADARSSRLSGLGPIAFDGDSLVFGEKDRIRTVGPTGRVTTIAGGGGPGFAADGSPALGAANGGVVALAFDSGAIYFTDGSWFRIRRIAGGIVATVAGSGSPAYSGEGGPALSAQLTAPLAIATDAAGNGYVSLLAPVPPGSPEFPALAADGPPPRLQSRVVKVSPSGVVTTIAGNGRLPTFNYDPRVRNGRQATDVPVMAQGGIAVDRRGNVYFAENNAGPSAEHGRFTAVDVARVDTSGVFTIVAGGGTSSADGVPATEAALHGVPGLVIDPMGNPVFVDSGPEGWDGTSSSLQTRVRRVNPDGTITTIAGGQPGFSGDGGLARAAQLQVPFGLAIDRSGNLFVADLVNHRIRRIDTRGRISTVAGTGGAAFSGDGGPAVDAGLVEPLGVAVDGSGNLFIADGTRVRRVDRAGVITTVAGTGVRGFAGDGGPATNADLSVLGGIAVDGPGDLLVADYQSGRVRKVTGVGTAAPTAEADTWGWNVLGQLGGGSVPDRPRPGPVTGSADVVHVGNGLYHGLGVRQDGTVVAWGANFSGQLGDGTVATRPSPVVVAGLDGVVGVAGGFGHSLALRADGTVWSWGLNSLGQLGDGTTVTRTRAAPVPGLTGVVAISAGMFHNLALKADGTVWAWGWNGYGQLGDGTTVNRSAPIPVPGLAAVVSVAAGGLHSLAVVTGGTGRAWGMNNVGQLGDGTTLERHRPVPVVGLTSASEVTAGVYHSLALATDGSVRAWGWNYFGQLGDGTTADRQAPVVVGGLPPSAAIAAGGLHTVAVTRTGSVLAWGFNAVGQVGDGTTTDRRSPVAVALSGATEPAAGQSYHSLVLRVGG